MKNDAQKKLFTDANREDTGYGLEEFAWRGRSADLVFQVSDWSGMT